MEVITRIIITRASKDDDFIARDKTVYELVSSTPLSNYPTYCVRRLLGQTRVRARLVSCGSHRRAFGSRRD